MPFAAEMTKVVSAWTGAEGAAGRKPIALGIWDKHWDKLAAELSEPVAQRILHPYEGSRHLPSASAYLGFWPKEAHAETNILCAIMQACPVHLALLELSRELLVTSQAQRDPWLHQE